LFYYYIFSDKEQPWLAESGEYNADFTELTLKLRKEAAWSDGKPFTADDVVFTLESQLNNEKLNYHAQFKEFVKSIEKVDDNTVKLTFNRPAPRFKFEVLTQKFDTGIPMVAKHAFDGVDDPTSVQGGLDMPHSGPYSVVSWNADQKILDLREDWWAVKAGLIPVPDVKRVIYNRIADMTLVAQRSVNNEYDATLDLRSDAIKSAVSQNPKITTHTGNNPPYGYLDWWPNSLWMNTQIEPFNDARVRKAISRAINREQINEVVYEGAPIATVYPFPLYPKLQAWVDSPEVKALEEKLQPGKYDLEESAALMTEAGFTKNADGLWEKDGKTVPAVISGFESIHSDIVPILVEMLKQGGFDASIDFSPTAYQNMADGKPGLYMFGHGASLIDPQATFDLYNSKYAAPIGTTAGSNRFSRYQNPEFDKIVDEMASLPTEDPKFNELALKALEIYWADVIDVPVIQWLHRIPYNQTYWTNWPTVENPDVGLNGAHWHTTAPQVITRLKAAQ
jgi:ABC-type transport system substrate-binding protein